MLYLIVIAAGMLLSSLLHSLFVVGLEAFPMALAASALAVVFAIAVDGVLAFIVRRLPERFFRADTPAFRVGKRERRLWRALGVQKWKDLVPELGVFTAFPKRRFDSATDTEYLARFLLESNYGVLGHILGAVAVFSILPIPFIGGVTVGLTVAVINFILSFLPIIILRYHTPSLTMLWKRSLKRKPPAGGSPASDTEKEQ